MNIKKLTYDLLQDSNEVLLGHSFKVSGILSAGMSSASIEVASDAGSLKLKINDESFNQKLLAKVPYYVGGPLMYHGPATILATLSAVVGEAVLVNIQSGSMIQGDKEYSF